MTRAIRLAAASLLAASLAAAPGLAAAAAPAAPAGRTGLVKIAYEEPKNPAHRPIYDHLRQVKLLEAFAEVLGAIRLPRPLTLKFAGCDGVINAWYEPENQTVTFCYEFVADFEKSSAGAAQYGIPRDDAVDGAVAFFMLHECGHALFHLLQVPILGREEDAADYVAAYTLLRLGKTAARRAISGAAWIYKHDAAARSLDESDYSDVHGLDVQRFYNVLCIAYGSDPDAYAGMVEKGYLPKDRAEGCHDEYEQLMFAVKKLIAKDIDVKAAQRTRAAHKAKWDAPRPSAAPAPAPAEKK